MASFTNMGPMICTMKVVQVITLMIKLPSACPSAPYWEKRLEDARASPIAAPAGRQPLRL